MPRTKRKCMKCYTFMCLGFGVGFWDWGKHFLYWGFGRWHFFIGVLSLYQAALLEKLFGGTVDRKDYSTETKAKAAYFRQTVF